MRVIYKYQLEDIAIQEVELPQGAVILDVQNQFEKLVLWAIVDTNNPFVIRIFKIYNTGDLVDVFSGRHISTVQLCGGNLIKHVFEV